MRIEAYLIHEVEVAEEAARGLVRHHRSLNKQSPRSSRTARSASHSADQTRYLFEWVAYLEFLLELLPAHARSELVADPSSPPGHALDTLDQLVQSREGLLVLWRVAEG